jgi:hypothetical protein
MAVWLLVASAAVPWHPTLVVAFLVSAKTRRNWKACIAIPLVLFASSCPLFEKVQAVASHQHMASLAASDDVPFFS